MFRCFSMSNKIYSSKQTKTLPVKFKPVIFEGLYTGAKPVFKLQGFNQSLRDTVFNQFSRHTLFNQSFCDTVTCYQFLCDTVFYQSSHNTVFNESLRYMVLFLCDVVKPVFTWHGFLPSIFVTGFFFTRLYVTQFYPVFTWHSCLISRFVARLHVTSFYATRFLTNPQITRFLTSLYVTRLFYLSLRFYNQSSRDAVF